MKRPRAGAGPAGTAALAFCLESDVLFTASGVRPGEHGGPITYRYEEDDDI